MLEITMLSKNMGVRGRGDTMPTQKLTLGFSRAEKGINAHIRNRKYNRVIKRRDKS